MKIEFLANPKMKFFANMKFRFLIKAVVFCLVLVLLFNMVTGIMLPKNVNWKIIQGFYDEPRNSLDIIFIGSSHSHCAANPYIIWNETGIPSYNFAPDGQPLWISYNYIKEALKYQKPKVIVLETYYTYSLNGQEYTIERHNKFNIDSMRMSLTKLQTINVSVPAQDRFKYVFNIFGYHTRWKELTFNDFKYYFSPGNDIMKYYNAAAENNQNVFKGYVYNTFTEPFTNVKVDTTNEAGGLKGKNLEYLNKIITLCKEEEVKLVFTKSPYPASQSDKKEQAIDNQVQKIAEENGIDFINFNKLISKIGLDWTKDFYDRGHLNKYGAAKTSKYIADYLNQNAERYSLQNKKDLKKYADWNEDANKYFEISRQDDNKLNKK